MATNQTSEADGQSAPIVPPKMARTLFWVAAGLTVTLLIVDVTEVFHWEVTSTALWLIGILVAIPIAERVRKIKVAGVEAEVEALRTQVDKLSDSLAEVNDKANAPAGDEDAPSGLARSAEAGAAVTPESAEVAGVLNRVVWVDDRPSINRLELSELQKRFDVLQVTNTDDGLTEIGRDPGASMAISDVVREERGKPNTAAGLEFVRAVKAQYAMVPVYVYAGASSVADHGAELKEAGARLVSATWSELAQQIRADARWAFEAAVANSLKGFADEVEQQSRGVDFIVVLRDARYAVEVRDWRRRPTAQAFDTATDLVGTLLSNGDVAAGAIVTPRDVVADFQRARLPQGVSVTTLDGLPSVLRPVEAAAG